MIQSRKLTQDITICIDETFIDQNALPNPYDLQKVLVSEDVVDCVTTLDNSTSLPTSVAYVPKAGKTGPALKRIFEKH